MSETIPYQIGQTLTRFLTLSTQTLTLKDVTPNFTLTYTITVYNLQKTWEIFFGIHINIVHTCAKTYTHP